MSDELSAAIAERPPIPAVVIQHVEEAAHLRSMRSVLVRAPHVRLLHLGRIDERIAAHLDGVAVAGSYGVGVMRRAFEQTGVGQVFVATVRAIEARDALCLDRLLAVAEAVPTCRPGLFSGFGWAAAADLKGITKGLLESVSPWRRQVGLTACAMHGADPGAMLIDAIRDPAANLRRCALRSLVRTLRLDMMDSCLAYLTDEDADCVFEAARSALLLGNRTEAVKALEAVVTEAKISNEHRIAALRLVLKVVSPGHARAMISELAKDASQSRDLMRGIAAAGDVNYIPWLIAQMHDLKVARIAGETFSLITGLDLALHDLDLKPPRDMEFGPNDDPNDDDVTMDEDDSLPWPNPVGLAAWWKKNSAMFSPGTRYFMGSPPSRESCIEVLRTGFQRQRIAAAEYLCLLSPRTPFFNTSAPAWRQQRLLVRMNRSQ